MSSLNMRQSLRTRHAFAVLGNNHSHHPISRSYTAQQCRSYTTPPCFRKGPTGTQPAVPTVPSTIQSWLPINTIPLATLSETSLKEAERLLVAEMESLLSQQKAQESARELMDRGSVGIQMTTNAIIMTMGLLQKARQCNSALSVLQQAVQTNTLDQGSEAVNEAVAVLGPYYVPKTGFVFNFEPPYYML
ncbi:hypothetical protein CcCBS67573_g08082 [Chytriomyces confervae]|uniref:Uncharacterized protein n=1 Tax=Chytriomyces confervae TaxID=246404 RepID=A0A507EQR3_9FUNG|nr:hypothetical protein CcCBS67573_g08082 [Chytriomyces confervae]